MGKKRIMYLGAHVSATSRQQSMAHYAPSHYTSPKAYGEMLLNRRSKKKTSC